MKKKLLIAFTALFLYGTVAAQKKIKLQFDDNGKFKIAQFTDIHWNHKSSTDCAKNIAIIKHVLNTEKPQLVILTGDIVTNAPAREAWLAIAELFEITKTPFALALGNHDAEASISKEKIFDLLLTSSYFVGEKGPNDIYGCGNYTLTINDAASKVAALVYCFDSNDYAPAKKYGHYDWIHYDQIAWYKKQSEMYTNLNNNIPLPALAFFHIPLPEYKNMANKNNVTGNKLEGIASPEINTGLFASMVEKQDVIGIFVGHDHDNDYIGTEYDIALAFGRVSGVGAYGKLERGARIIELYEGKSKFDTWICTLSKKEFFYYFPSGISSVDEKNETYLPAHNIKPARQGVNYAYYEGKFKNTNQITSARMIETGIMRNISIKEAQAEDHFAYEFRAWIQIPETGIYRFYTYSDDGSVLFIDGKTVVNNDGSHSAQRKDGKVGLEVGLHELRVLYFEDHMGQTLEIGVASRDIRETTIPDHWLYIIE